MFGKNDLPLPPDLNSLLDSKFLFNCVRSPMGQFLVQNKEIQTIQKKVFEGTFDKHKRLKTIQQEVIAKIEFLGTSEEKAFKEAIRDKINCAIQLKSAFETTTSHISSTVATLFMAPEHLLKFESEGVSYDPFIKFNYLMTYIPMQAAFSFFFINTTTLMEEYQQFKNAKVNISCQLEAIFPKIDLATKKILEQVICQARILLIAYSESYFSLEKNITFLLQQNDNYTMTDIRRWQREMIEELYVKVKQHPDVINNVPKGISLMVNSERNLTEKTWLDPNFLLQGDGHYLMKKFSEMTMKEMTSGDLSSLTEMGSDIINSFGEFFQNFEKKPYRGKKNKQKEAVDKSKNLEESIKTACRKGKKIELDTLLKQNRQYQVTIKDLIEACEYDQYEIVSYLKK